MGYGPSCRSRRPRRRCANRASRRPRPFAPSVASAAVTMSGPRSKHSEDRSSPRKYKPNLDLCEGQIRLGLRRSCRSLAAALDPRRYGLSRVRMGRSPRSDCHEAERYQTAVWSRRHCGHHLLEDDRRLLAAWIRLEWRLRTKETIRSRLWPGVEPGQRGDRWSLDPQHLVHQRRSSTLHPVALWKTLCERSKSTSPHSLPCPSLSRSVLNLVPWLVVPSR
jgi:hypothetical protein